MHPLSLIANTSEKFQSVCKELQAEYPTMHFVPTHPIYANAVSLLEAHLKPGDTLLEVGASGPLAFMAKRMGWQVSALDHSTDWPTSIRIGNKCLTFSQLCSCEAILSYAVNVETDKLPFNDATFDAVVMTEVIEHLWCDPLHTITEINRVLKHNSGVLVLSTPNLTCIKNRIHFAIGKIENILLNPLDLFYNKQKKGYLFDHLRIYSPNELTSMLTTLGFDCSFKFVQVDLQREVIKPHLNCNNTFNNTQYVSNILQLPYYSLFTFLSKFIRTPLEFLKALYSTILDLMERSVPPFRPRMFVVARKVKDANTISEPTTNRSDNLL